MTISTSSLEEGKSSNKARAQRIRRLRGMMDLSRREFAIRYGIPARTLQNWEDAKGNGLTEAGARKITGVFKAEGIHCTIEWLLHGVGSPPEIPYIDYPSSISTQQEWLVKDDAQIALIMQELKLFQEHYPHAIDFIVADDGMEPCFTINEYIAGNRRFQKDIETIVSRDCIVQTAEGEKLLRQVKAGSIPGHYNLICTNINTTVAKPILYDVELISAAPVIWTRKKDH